METEAPYTEEQGYPMFSRVPWTMLGTVRDYN